MDVEREFELQCELRNGAVEKPQPTYYIDPNQFGEDDFTAGSDETYDDEGEARDAAFYLARMNGRNVTIDVFCEGQDNDIIVIKPTVRVA